jgi:glycosyltransferase involved in cell wall biosynthesis
LERIVFTVTNQLNYDQRMIRICTSLAQAGYCVTLVGVNTGGEPLTRQPYHQKRLSCLFKKGLLFYAAYNIRLFFYLLFKPCDVLCCIDLDTMLPVFFAGKLRGKKVVYDAHEYFSQQKEIITRPGVYRVWHWIERTFVPKIKYGYTVSHSIAAAFEQLYHVQYGLVMNCTVLKPLILPADRKRSILYQGAVNEARGLEQLVPAMKQIDACLYIYGDGNFMAQCRELIAANGLEHKVFLKGKVLPAALEEITANAWLGINLVENNGLNQYYSLANKFFDYVHYAVPQVTMDFPEYRKINNEFEVAVLIEDTSEQKIVNTVNRMMVDDALYLKLQQQCIKARDVYCWQNEEKKLLSFYNNLIHKKNQS